MAEKVKDSKKSDEDVLRVARKRFQIAVEAETKIRKEGLDDLRFRVGEQWPLDVKQAREQDGRPCLTINRLPQFVRQITNDQRQNRSSIQVDPVDDKATIETAKVFQGLIRHIEYNSNADVAYDTGFESAVIKGDGYYRVITDYADAESFDQEIFIKRIRNSFSVYLDPASQEPDGSDAGWGFVFEDMPIDDYKAQYPNSDISTANDWAALGNTNPTWIKDKAVRVAEYFYKTFKEVDLVLLSDGSVKEKSELPEIPGSLGMHADGSPVQVVNERKSTLPAIKWCKINGVEILEETDWLGQWIPIIPIRGDEIDLDGEIIREGIIRHARDPQRMYNYWASSETETIALAPRAPYIGYEGQFEGHEEQWKSANRKNHAFLQVKPTTIAGQPAPIPARQAFEAPVQAITQARMQSSEDMKATMGIYDASLGNRSNEQSGVGIMRRNQQSERTNFHYIDNLTRSKKHLGRILVDLIPKVYDTAKVVRILHEDGDIEMVAINQIFEKNGQKTAHFLNVGSYDVTISTGPSYATKRQEAVADMLQLTQAYPKVAEVAGDLMVRNMDWEGASEIADRLKKTLPPGIADDKDSKQMPIPPQVQAQMQQMGQMIDQLTQHLNQKTKFIEEKTLELESRERIELAKLESNAAIELARLQSKDAHAILNHQINEIKTRLDMVGNNQPLDTNNGQGSDPNQVAQPQAQMNQQQPTGGNPPGQSMGGNP